MGENTRRRNATFLEIATALVVTNSMRTGTRSAEQILSSIKEPTMSLIDKDVVISLVNSQ